MQGRRATLFLSLILHIWSHGFAIAQDAAVTVNQVTDEVHTGEKNWSASLGVKGTRDAKDLEQGSQLSIESEFAYTWLPNLTSSLFVGFDQNFTPERDWTFQDVRLNHSYKLPELPYEIKPSVSLRQLAPTSKASLDQSLVTQQRLRADLSKTFFNLVTLNPFGYGFYNFYRYDYGLGNSPEQTPNVQIGGAFGGVLSVQYKWFKVSTEWRLIFLRTYINSAQTKYLHDTFVEFMPNERLSIDIGITNTGATTRNGGRDSNIAFFDQNQSQIYGSTTVSF
jgi:hypothetical protein